MTAPELLATLRRLGARVWADGDRLRINAGKGVLTRELEAEIKKHKEAILETVRRVTAPQSRVGAMAPASRDGFLPLSFFQERVWIIDRLGTGNPAYNLVAVLHHDLGWDPEALEASLTEMVRRHEILRTTFRDADGSPWPDIHPPRALVPVVDDLRGIIETEREEALRRIVQAEAAQPMDLAHGPLFRARAVRLTEGDSVLVVSMHHIIADAWSMGLFLNEWKTLYRCSSTKEPANLPAPAGQYVDYATWQRRWENGPEFERLVDFWTEELAGAPTVLTLPMARQRPPMETFAGEVAEFKLDPEVAGALKEFARAQHATLFMALLAIFNVLLYRYTGQRDILIGSPVSTRDQTQLEGIIGPFVNSIVYRTTLNEQDTPTTLLQRVRKTALAAHEHRQLPFEKLVEAVNPQRSMAYPPLFQVALTFHNAPERSAFSVTTGGAMYELSLFAWEIDGTIGGSIEYNRALFERACIERMLSHLCCLIGDFVARPDEAVSHLALLSEGEQQALMALAGGPASDDDRGATFAGRFEERVAERPVRTAVITEERRLSYDELNRLANRIGSGLQKRGVRPGVKVGICMERSPEMLAALLGVMKAGGAYVPLDPSYPTQRLQYMIDDSGASVLLTDRTTSGVIAGNQLQVLELNEDGRGIPGVSEDNVSAEVGPDDLAYVIYTSGSTGRPKGVEISHGALLNLLGAMRHEPGLDQDDVLVAITTLSFDIAALELYLPLLVGAKIVLASRDTAENPAALRALMTEHEATVMQATPATWRMLVETAWHAEDHLPHFRVWCGGETLPRTLAEALCERAGEVWNLYGPTETTIWSTSGRVEPGDGPVPIGRPIANTQVYVLDSLMQPVPIGVPGELYIGGSGIARGYHDRNALTRERFVPDPFRKNGGRLYRTGDLARFRADGQLVHLGRIDDQVKVRGFRIELGEIEAVLGRHEDVAAAVASVWDSRIVAFVVPKSGRALTPTEARRFLRDHVPEYMVPSFVVPLDELPLTPNGKVDRAALPDPRSGGVIEDRTVTPPRSPSEQLVAEVWADVLGVDDLSVHNNFFDRGGHSLLAVKAVYTIEQRSGVPLDPRAIFFETLEQLAARVDRGVAEVAQAS